MGFLNFFSKASAPSGPVQIPSGSFTVDNAGRIVTSTLPKAFPEALQREIAQAVITSMTEGAGAGIRGTEFVVSYPTLKITAREMKGSIMIFLAPKASGAR